MALATMPYDLAVISAGWLSSNGTGTQVHYGIARYAQDGSSLGRVEWPPADTARPGQNYVVGVRTLNRIQLSDTGQAIVTGHVPGNTGDRDFMTIAYSGDLSALIWSARFDFTDDPERYTGDDVPVDLWALRLSDPSPALIPYVAVTGYSQSSNAGTDIQTVVYNSTGAPLTDATPLRYTSSGAHPDWPCGVYLRRVSDSPDYHMMLIVGGTTWTSNGNAYVVLVYDIDTQAPAAATLVSTLTYGVSDYACDAMAMKVIDDPVESLLSVVVTGTKTYLPSEPPGQPDYLTVKWSYNASTQAWSQSWVETYDNGDDDTAVAVDGDVIKNTTGGFTEIIAVTGRSYSSSTGYDATTIVYADAHVFSPPSVTHAKQWTGRLDGIANGDDRGVAVKVYPSDDGTINGSGVYVTASATNGVPNLDYMAALYDGLADSGNKAFKTNGRLFFPLVTSGTPGDDVPIAMTLIRVGSDWRAFVTGRTATTTQGDNFLTQGYHYVVP
ncbi:MAG: hypothetical protein JNM80_01780 [Phycisphaerae bacterium]|nr:hypothetical protein [Phycisphaerae bacterium]